MRSVFSKGGLWPTAVLARQTCSLMESLSRYCIMGWRDGAWRVNRHLGLASVPRFLLRASSLAASLAEVGRPASSFSSLMMSSQALVASRRFSEYF